jgi:hypothetical protein
MINDDYRLPNVEIMRISIEDYTTEVHMVHLGTISTALTLLDLLLVDAPLMRCIDNKRYRC